MIVDYGENIIIVLPLLHSKYLVDQYPVQLETSDLAGCEDKLEPLVSVSSNANG